METSEDTLDYDALMARIKAAEDAVEEYWEGREPGGENEANDPQHRLAPEFFDLYLRHRPQDTAYIALHSAFDMWAQLDGGSDTFDQKLDEISSDEMAIATGIQFVPIVYTGDARDAEAEQRVEQLLNMVTSPAVRSGILSDLVRGWMWNGEAVKARAACAQIMALNADERYVAHAKKALHELDNLNVGQMAPTFVRTSDAETVDLSLLRGQVVLLDFWATWCGPCRSEFPHLRRVAQDFGDKGLALISISLDDDVDAAKRMIKKEKLAWNHVFEGGWGDAGLPTLYSVMGIPSTWLLDKAGRIHAKGLRGHELDKEIAALLDARD